MATIEHMKKSNTRSLSDKDFTILFENIFEVCSELPQFKKLKSDVNILEERKSEFKSKISKQQSLLNQSFQIEKDISKKLRMLKNENEEVITKLLSILGSEQ